MFGIILIAIIVIIFIVAKKSNSEAEHQELLSNAYDDISSKRNCQFAADYLIDSLSDSSPSVMWLYEDPSSRWLRITCHNKGWGLHGEIRSENGVGIERDAPGRPLIGFRFDEFRLEDLSFPREKKKVYLEAYTLFVLVKATEACPHLFISDDGIIRLR